MTTTYPPAGPRAREELKRRSQERTPWTERPGWVARCLAETERSRQAELARQGRLAVVEPATPEQLEEFTRILQELVPEDQPIPIKIQNILRDRDSKACTGCRVVLRLEEFHSGATDCKPCANERSAAYHRRNPLVKKLNHGLNRARRAGNHYEEVTPEDLYEHWESVGIDPARCYYTGEPIPDGEISLDHGHPIGAGGPHTVHNLFPTTLETNNRKRSRTVEEFLEVLTSE